MVFRVAVSTSSLSDFEVKIEFECKVPLSVIVSTVTSEFVTFPLLVGVLRCNDSVSRAVLEKDRVIEATTKLSDAVIVSSLRVAVSVHGLVPVHVGVSTETLSSIESLVLFRRLLCDAAVNEKLNVVVGTAIDIVSLLERDAFDQLEGGVLLTNVISEDEEDTVSVWLLREAKRGSCDWECVSFVIIANTVEETVSPEIILVAVKIENSSEAETLSDGVAPVTRMVCEKVSLPAEGDSKIDLDIFGCVRVAVYVENVLSDGDMDAECIRERVGAVGVYVIVSTVCVFFRVPVSVAALEIDGPLLVTLFTVMR